MMRPKQPLNSISTSSRNNNNKNPTTRKPSLPIKRASSVQSALSDQSCMSDRVVYTQVKRLSNKEQKCAVQFSTIDAGKFQEKQNKLKKQQRDVKSKEKQVEKKKYQTVSSTDVEQTSMLKNTSSNTNSQKNLKKIKSKLSIPQASPKNANDPILTCFQWLIIVRHCFHVQNKRRCSNTIKQRTLINYIKNKVYPDSLWNKIMVMDNQRKISSAEIIALFQKNSKWKMTLDDIFACVGKAAHSDNNKGESKGDGNGEQPQSAAQTARFTENMKPNLQNKQSLTQDNYYSQPKFIYKQSQKSKNIDRIINTSNVSCIQQSVNSPIPTPVTCHNPPVPACSPNSRPISSNSSCIKQDPSSVFQLDPPCSLFSVSPIYPLSPIAPISSSIVSPLSAVDPTNDISFSIQDNNLSNSQNSYSTSLPMHSQQDPLSQRFQYGFNGIMSLKKSLQMGVSTVSSSSANNINKNSQEKVLLINYLEQILGYTIYKNKNKSKSKNYESVKNVSNFNFKRGLSKTGTSQSLQLQETQYLHGLKLESRNYISKLPGQILQRLFSSREFSEYFHSLQMLKISGYNSQLSLTLPLLSSSLRILNLSSNNLRSLSFLRNMHPYNNLQFLNLNQNRLTNMCQLLTMPQIIQIHIRNNQIDHMHIGREKIQAKKLKIIDIAYNSIQNQEDIWVINQLQKIQMVNLTGNPIMNTITNRKDNEGVLRKDVITDHAQIYVFSSYTQYKDIAFSANKSQYYSKNSNIDSDNNVKSIGKTRKQTQFLNSSTNQHKQTVMGQQSRSSKQKSDHRKYNQ